VVVVRSPEKSASIISATTEDLASNKSSNPTNDQPFEDTTLLGIRGELAIVYTKGHLALVMVWLNIENFNVPGGNLIVVLLSCR